MQLDADIGMMLAVSYLGPTYKFPFFERFLGLEFTLKLCVDDDERAGTVLTVSNK